MRDPIPWLAGAARRQRVTGPPPATHQVCTATLAWARSQGIDDASLVAIAETFRTTRTRFFDWDGMEVDVIGDLLVPRDNRDDGACSGLAFEWDDTHLAGEIVLSEEVSIHRGRIRIAGTYPEAWLASLVGRPLGNLLAMPFPLEATVAATSVDGGIVEVEISPRWTGLPTA